MGCDIHMYAEYTGDPAAGHWAGFGGRINPGRDYDLFGKLAGVRTDGQMFPVRGKPDHLGIYASSDDSLYITNEPGDGNATRELAEDWVARGISRWTDEREVFVTNPDNHTHSWVTPAELRQALEAPARWDHPTAYWALLAALEELERRGKTARVVFWFDN
ncbi:hypothetical protein [Phenylobacterium sp.]|uniref:hypothetical protein n=1 Tax=Phenylobacterium sp. TaxID=1871053 RepID=UPI00261EEBC7|nr:hypothetical protein [Phenylobacterium sp.]